MVFVCLCFILFFASSANTYNSFSLDAKNDSVIPSFYEEFLEESRSFLKDPNIIYFQGLEVDYQWRIGHIVQPRGYSWLEYAVKLTNEGQLASVCVSTALPTIYFNLVSQIDYVMGKDDHEKITALEKLGKAKTGEFIDLAISYWGEPPNNITSPGATLDYYFNLTVLKLLCEARLKQNSSIQYWLNIFRENPSNISSYFCTTPDNKNIVTALQDYTLVYEKIFDIFGNAQAKTYYLRKIVNNLQNPSKENGALYQFFPQPHYVIAFNTSIPPYQIYYDLFNSSIDQAKIRSKRDFWLNSNKYNNQNRKQQQQQQDDPEITFSLSFNKTGIDTFDLKINGIPRSTLPKGILLIFKNLPVGHFFRGFLSFYRHAKVTVTPLAFSYDGSDKGWFDLSIIQEALTNFKSKNESISGYRFFSSTPSISNLECIHASINYFLVSKHTTKLIEGVTGRSSVAFNYTDRNYDFGARPLFATLNQNLKY